MHVAASGALVRVAAASAAGQGAARVDTFACRLRVPLAAPALAPCAPATGGAGGALALSCVLAFASPLARMAASCAAAGVPPSLGAPLRGEGGARTVAVRCLDELDLVRGWAPAAPAAAPCEMAARVAFARAGPPEDVLAALTGVRGGAVAAGAHVWCGHAVVLTVAVIEARARAARWSGLYHVRRTQGGGCAVGVHAACASPGMAVSARLCVVCCAALRAPGFL